MPDTPEELLVLEREVEREWWWLNGALHAVAELQAEPSRFMHQRAGLDAEGLRGVARRDGAGRLYHRRDDDDRFAPQRRIFLLLAGSEKTIEIENEPAQQSSPHGV